MADPFNNDNLTPAWGGPREPGGIPVPGKFDSVIGLGRASAVYGRNRAILLPGFGKPKMLVMYQNGFAYQKGNDVHPWRWEEISQVVSKVWMTGGGSTTVSTNHEYTFIKPSGEKFMLDDTLENVEDIIEPIKENVFALLAPPLMHQYDDGHSISFGPVTVHRLDGLQMDGKGHAWNGILDIKLERGRFTVTPRDGRKKEVRASAIPNIEILCHLIGLKLISPQLIYY